MSADIREQSLHIILWAIRQAYACGQIERAIENRRTDANPSYLRLWSHCTFQTDLAVSIGKESLAHAVCVPGLGPFERLDHIPRDWQLNEHLKKREEREIER